MKPSMRKWLSFYNTIPCPNIWVSIGLVAIIGLALAVRLPQPIHDPSIGEIDVYFWALRTQEFLLHGWSGIGTSLWVTPVVMGGIHQVIGGSLYNTFLWTGSFLTAVFPPIGIYLLTKELANSKIAGLFGALAIAINPVILYRSVFTVSETFAYVIIPWSLFFAVRLVRTRSRKAFFAMVISVLLAMQTHDSSKLLVLPALFAVLSYFWSTRKQRSTWIIVGLSVIGALGLLVYDKTIIAGLKFFLWPNNAGNSAFGKFPPVPLSDYLNVSTAVFSAFALAGFLFWLLRKRTNRRAIVVIVTFLLPILFFQQIQPRISDSTIVPFRLTPYLAFLAAPFFGIAIAGWLRLVRRSNRLAVPVLSVGFLLIVAQIGFAKYPLPYVTGMEEQQSLLMLPITRQDLLITQTSMIGMTGVATKTSEANYYGDLTDRVLGAQTGSDARERLKSFIAENVTQPTGVLISKWKIVNRDPKFGWWDSLVNPSLRLDAWRSSGLPIRFEDANIIIFDIPENF